MVDVTGTTTYSYDSRDRLTGKATPEGTVGYRYDHAGNLLSLTATSATSNLTTAVSYTYDSLNRLSTVAEANTGTTNYTYVEAGNLASFAQPNGVTHAYTYDGRNRLRNLSVAPVSSPASPLASYAYTLDNAGHRTSVTEQSGRTVTHAYDNIYRLTSETIASDPNSLNGAVGYTYDNVGNRTQQTSTVTVIPAGVFNYDANDRVSTDTYDPNGNTLATTGNPNTNVYDFENRLIQQGQIAITYDGDGSRVAKAVAGVATKYLVDDQNPTGYAQVVLEDNTATGEKQYVYGLQLLSERYQASPGSSPFTPAYYGYDGHGSVRFLMDATGAVTDTYDYDAFGNLLYTTGTTPNVYRFAGERAATVRVFLTVGSGRDFDDPVSNVHRRAGADRRPLQSAISRSDMISMNGPDAWTFPCGKSQT
jgi:YD repeat-containing protein